MAEGRRLPKWMMMVGDEEQIKNKNKKHSAGEKPTTFPAKSKTKHKKPRQEVEDDSIPISSAKVVRKNRRRKAPNAVRNTPSPIIITHHHHQQEKEKEEAAEAEADLTADDLVTIAQEYVKLSNDSHSHSVFSLDAQLSTITHSPPPTEPCFTLNDATSSCSGDPALHMLHLFLGPLLNKPTGS